MSCQEGTLHTGPASGATPWFLALPGHPI